MHFGFTYSEIPEKHERGKRGLGRGAIKKMKAKTIATNIAKNILQLKKFYISNLSEKVILGKI